MVYCVKKKELAYLIQVKTLLFKLAYNDRNIINKIFNNPIRAWKKIFN